MSSQARSIDEGDEDTVEGAVGTARAARSRPSSWATRAGYAAFAWALLFAAAHVYWAFGGTALLGGQAPDLSAGALFAQEP